MDNILTDNERGVNASLVSWLAECNGNPALNTVLNAIDTNFNDFVLTTGWLPDSNTWTRTGDYTFTTTDIDLTSVYREGLKIKFIDSSATVKYGVVKSSVFGAGVNTITLVSNNKYLMLAGTVSSTFISQHVKPEGFPNWLEPWSDIRARAYLSSDMPNLTHAAEVLVLLDTDTGLGYDPDNDFDTGTRLYTAPIAGIYEIKAQATFQEVVISKQYLLRIKINGVEVLRSTVQASEATSISVLGADNIALDAGDTVGLYVIQSSGVNTVDIGGESFLTYLTIALKNFA